MGVVGRVLNGGKIIHLVFSRHNYDSSRVLSRRPLYANAILYDTLHLSLAYAYALALKIFGNKAVCGLVRKCTERSRAEHVFRTEKLLGVLMNTSLNVSREVKVDIGGLVSVESKEGLKGDIVTVGAILCAALGTHLVGKIKARAYRAVGYKLGILTLGAIVVRRQRIYLGNTRHGSNERRSNRAS